MLVVLDVVEEGYGIGALHRRPSLLGAALTEYRLPVVKSVDRAADQLPEVRRWAVDRLRDRGAPILHHRLEPVAGRLAADALTANLSRLILRLLPEHIEDAAAAVSLLEGVAEPRSRLAREAVVVDGGLEDACVGLEGAVGGAAAVGAEARLRFSLDVALIAVLNGAGAMLD
jgi:hypothetical protein